MNRPFRDVDHAIKFAFAIREYRIEPKTMLARLVVTEHGAELLPGGHLEMTPHDWHAQGSLIISRITSLPRLQMVFAIAFYSWGMERAMALEELALHIGKACTIDNKDLCRDLVHQYVDRYRGLAVKSAHAIYKKAGISWRQFETQSELAASVLKSIETQMQDELHNCWASTGLIESHNAVAQA